VADANSGKTSIIQFPHLILGAVAIFLHVGSQVTGINTVIGYAQSLDMPLLEAKVFPSYILGITMFGFLLGIVLIPKFINHLNVLRICTTSAIVLTLLFFIVHGQVTFLGHTADLSIWFLVLLGLSNPHSAYWVLLPCYIYLVYYAYYGYSVRNWSLKKIVSISNK